MGMTMDELQARASKLERFHTDKKPPYWEYWRAQMWYHLNNDNPKLFYKWPSVYHTMLVNHWEDVVGKEIKDLPQTYLRLANMPIVSTNDYYKNTEYSRNLIHQLYHFWQWEQFSSKKVSQLNTIIEIGAGYGAMALLARRLGFRGDYYICDLPEFCLLQEYFLSNVMIYNKDIYYNAPLPKSADLLIACYSLSEMPIAERKGYLYDIDARSYLFLFSQEWVDYDNLHYFKQFAELTPHAGTWEWLVKPSRYLPQGNWYSFGNRIDNGQI